MSAVDFSSIESPQQRGEDIRASIINIVESMYEQSLLLTVQTMKGKFPMKGLMRAYLAREMIGKLAQMLDDSSISMGGSLLFHGSPPADDGEMTLNDLLNIAKGLSAPASNPMPLRHTCLSYLLTDMAVNFGSGLEISKIAINLHRSFGRNPLGIFFGNILSNYCMRREDAVSKLSARTAAAIRSVTPAVELSFPFDCQIGMKTFYKLLERGLRDAGINPPGTLALPGPSIRFGGQ
jgi:hypothetical protein